jgi:hypothetical protein
MKRLLSKTLMMVVLTILAVGNLLAVGRSARGEKLDVQALNKIIGSKKMHWVAGETSKSKLFCREACIVRAAQKEEADMEQAEWICREACHPQWRIWKGQRHYSGGNIPDGRGGEGFS